MLHPLEPTYLPWTSRVWLCGVPPFRAHPQPVPCYRNQPSAEIWKTQCRKPKGACRPILSGTKSGACVVNLPPWLDASPRTSARSARRSSWKLLASANDERAGSTTIPAFPQPASRPPHATASLTERGTSCAAAQQQNSVGPCTRAGLWTGGAVRVMVLDGWGSDAREGAGAVLRRRRNSEQGEWQLQG